MINAKDPIDEEIHLELLFKGQPYLKNMIAFLKGHFANKEDQRIFAPINEEHCGACNIAIAKVKLAIVQRGHFIACAHCSRFLYISEIVNKRETN